MSTQGELDFDGWDNPSEKYTKEQFQKMEKERFAEEARQNEQRDKEIDKARARKAEAEEFKDKRTPKSPLIQQAEMAKIRDILSKPRGGVGGAGMGDVGVKGIGKKSKLDYAKGGKISSASKRADGCAQRGKTRGRMV